MATVCEFKQNPVFLQIIRPFVASRYCPTLAMKKQEFERIECCMHQKNQDKFGLYYKLVYIYTGVKEDCAASLARINKLNS